MNTAFQFVALPHQIFANLFTQSETELSSNGIRRLKVEEHPGTPCRVSLADAEVGETVLAVPFTHHEVSSPYRASGPIFVREGITTANPAVGEVPLMFRHRLLSIRGYDVQSMMVAAEVATGTELENIIHEMFSQAGVAYIHLHNARPGCFNCSVMRASNVAVE